MEIFKKFTFNRNDLLWSVFCFLMFCFMYSVFANTSGTSMPYDSAFDKFLGSRQGKVAYSIVILGLILAGVGVIWGGEIAQWVKTVCMIILAGASITFAAQIYGTFFSSACVLPDVLNAEQLHALLLLK